MNGEPDPPDDLLPVDEAARFLHLSEAELAVLWTMGKGPKVAGVDGRRPLYTLRALIDWQILRRGRGVN